ncbi:quercetin dioxygenase-like cupin family protein [Flavobacterium sp. 270]|uniref:cupin domain-containing protein n=1 Tax=Flavobacterium sp. 270 TaxID=2512114 RepID=UPI0010652AE1|nr:cupin domain-containing protein [Flavobacterium sp. 270]TDW48787.1 quercetin dioxygenase-like cupin family protein [Flavobacterium sp. 270]
MKKTQNTPKKNLLSTVIVVFIFALFILPNAINAQKSEIKRTDLQQHDLSIPGKEAVQATIDFGPHTAFGKHYHPGEEIIYVLKGAIEYEVEGSAPVMLKAGDVLFIPAGTVHAAKNNTNENAVELATYVVEKGKQLVVMKK